MKKKAAIFVAVILAIAVVAFLVLGSMLGEVIRKGVETVGPEATGTTVTLGGVSLSPLSGSGGISDLIVGNPEGFKTDSSFKLGNISLSVDPGTVASDVIVIREIVVDGAEVTWEGSLKGSNISKIQENIDKFAGPAEAPAAEEKPAEAKAESETKIIIDRFVFKNAKVRLSATMLKGKAATLPLPEIVLTDIGRKDNGALVSEAIKQMTSPIFKGIGEAVIKSKDLLGEEGVGGKVKEGVGDALGKVKGLLNR